MILLGLVISVAFNLLWDGWPFILERTVNGLGIAVVRKRLYQLNSSNQSCAIMVEDSP